MEIKKFNIYIVGDEYVGKSSFAKRYFDNIFKLNYLETLGVNCLKKKITVLNQDCLVSLFDLSGNERYGEIGFGQKRKIDAIIFMYDVTSEYGLNSIENWFDIVPKKIKDNCHKFLIGTKIDLEKE